jgi:hypothetical protein
MDTIPGHGRLLTVNRLFLKTPIHFLSETGANAHLQTIARAGTLLGHHTEWNDEFLFKIDLSSPYRSNAPIYAANAEMSASACETTNARFAQNTNAPSDSEIF